jgi:hypothetical protein
LAAERNLLRLASLAELIAEPDLLRTIPAEWIVLTAHSHPLNADARGLNVAITL